MPGGDHHLAITGVHGIGVSVPSAAAVALATAGLPGDLHIPNGAMFTIATASRITATVRPGSVTRKVPGAYPQSQNVVAPEFTRTAPTAGGGAGPDGG